MMYRTQKRHAGQISGPQDVGTTGKVSRGTMGGEQEEFIAFARSLETSKTYVVFGLCNHRTLVGKAFQVGGRLEMIEMWCNSSNSHNYNRDLSDQEIPIIRGGHVTIKWSQSRLVILVRWHKIYIDT